MIWLRRLALPALLAAGIFAASRAGALAGATATAAALIFLALVFLIFPRIAHAAFERGDHARAEVYYRLVRVFVASPAARGALAVSLAGCRLARGDFDGAVAELDAVAPSTLGVAARAAWHNNRAYALARGGGENRAQALADIDEAVRLLPEIAGFRHTRGVVLLSLGRVDDAIAELDEVWQRVAASGAPPLLEAERCFDLGRAWAEKGELDYARDYFSRAQAVAPGSKWAARARERA